MAAQWTRGVSLRQLRIFEAVARLGSISRAAEELHLTQPAVSMQVKTLDGLIGLPLIETLGKKLRVTDVGLEVARYARAIEHQLAEAEAALAQMAAGHAGLVSVGVVSTAKYIAPKLLMAFRAVFPDVQVRISLHNREDIFRQLEDNLIDIAIMGRPPAALGCDAHVFAEHPLSILARDGHPLADGRTASTEALARETFLIRERGSGTRMTLEGFLIEYDIRPAEIIELPSNEIIKQAAIAGMGLAFLSEHTCQLELRTGVLRRVIAPGTPVIRNWHVVYRDRKNLLPAAQVLRDFLLAKGGGLVNVPADAMPLG
jgi:DNA-binding transcriptional LysR family regulator